MSLFWAAEDKFLILRAAESVVAAPNPITVWYRADVFTVSLTVNHTHKNKIIKT